MPFDKVILDLCGGTGSWSNPYWENDYTVLIIDPQDLTDHTYTSTVEAFIQEPKLSHPIHGILAAPPCTEFSGSGALWWEKKDMADITKLLSATETVRSCLSAVRLYGPTWWALENPVGRLPAMVPELGRPTLTFDPCDYGDPYTKKTLIWGKFNVPRKERVPPTEGSKVLDLGPSDTRAMDRSQTPRGFAEAFFKANP